MGGAPAGRTCLLVGLGRIEPPRSITGAHRVPRLRPPSCHEPRCFDRPSYAGVVSAAALDYDERKLAELCRRYGIARLEVFGSVARGTAEPDSDVDLLDELVPGASLGWEIDDLQQELRALLGRTVDLVAKRALHRRLQAEVPRRGPGAVCGVTSSCSTRSRRRLSA